MTNIPAFENNVTNTKYTVALARELMMEYLMGEINRDNYLDFISTNHEDTLELINYDDKEFDKINQTALEDTLKIKLDTLYEPDVRQRISEELNKEESDYTLQDVLDNEVTNFFTVLDLENDAVREGLGELAYEKINQRGKILGELSRVVGKTSRFKNPKGNDVAEEAFASEQVRQGFMQAKLRDIYRTLDGIDSEYPEEFFNLRQDMTLTPAQENRWGYIISNWLEENDLKYLPSSRKIEVENMDDQNFYEFLNIIAGADPIKWKTYLKLLARKWVKADRERAATEDDEIDNKKLQELLTLPDTHIADIEQYIDELKPPNSLVETQRGQILDRKETVDLQVLREAIEEFLTNSKINYSDEISTQGRKYSMETGFGEWKLADKNFKIRAGRSPYNLITSTSTHENFDEIPVLTETQVKTSDEVDILMAQLVPPNQFSNKIKNVIEAANTLSLSMDEIEKIYNLISQNPQDEEDEEDEEESDSIEIQESSFENIKESLEEGITELLSDKENVITNLSNKNNETFNEKFENLKDGIEEIIEMFSTYENSLQEDDLSDNDKMDLDRIIDTLEECLKQFSTNIKKPLTLKEIQNYIETFLDLEHEEALVENVLRFKNSYDRIINEREENKGVLVSEDIDNIKVSLSQIFNRTEKTKNKKSLSKKQIRNKIISFLPNSEKPSQQKIVDLIINTITNNETNTRKWGQATKWSSAGKINFKITVVDSSTKDIIKVNSTYKQTHEVKLIFNIGVGGGDLYSTAQKKRSQTDKASKVRSYNITLEGKKIVSSGKAVDEDRKKFIDNIDDKLQRLRRVI